MKQVSWLSHARSNLLDCSDSCFVYTLLESEMSKEPETIQEKHMNYMRGLSTVVGEACDRYFKRKGMPTSLSWAAQVNQQAKKKDAEKRSKS